MTSFPVFFFLSLISFSNLFGLTRTSRTILNWYKRVANLALFQILVELFRISPHLIWCYLSALHKSPLFCLGMSRESLISPRHLSRWGVRFLSKNFTWNVEMIMCFTFFQFVSMVDYADIFSYVPCFAALSKWRRSGLGVRTEGDR